MTFFEVYPILFFITMNKKYKLLFSGMFTQLFYILFS